MINAVRIVPSSPISVPNGSKKFIMYDKIGILLMFVFVKNQIIIPAGIVIYMALPKTNIVLSKIDLIIVFSIFGFLYGGSSRVNEDCSPFKMVFDRIFDMISVISIENIMNPKSIRADSMDVISLFDAFVTKKMDIIAISDGNLPLHGENTFVRMAISFSFFDSIILHPITPQALHPYPIHIVNDCFPWAPHFLNILSILKAILGRYPKSSKRVNSGKNIAIGGSITDVTHATVLYMPFNKKSVSDLFIFRLSAKINNLSYILKRNWYRSSDG